MFNIKHCLYLYCITKVCKYMFALATALIPDASAQTTRHLNTNCTFTVLTSLLTIVSRVL